MISATDSVAKEKKVKYICMHNTIVAALDLSFNQEKKNLSMCIMNAKNKKKCKSENQTKHNIS